MQALQLQQKRHLNIHEYQGAQLMAKFGINVPDGVPAFTVDEVAKAAEKMKDEKGEVRSALHLRRHASATAAAVRGRVEPRRRGGHPPATDAQPSRAMRRGARRRRQRRPMQPRHWSTPHQPHASCAPAWALLHPRSGLERATMRPTRAGRTPAVHLHTALPHPHPLVQPPAHTPAPPGRPQEPDPRRRPRPGALHQRPAGRRPHLQRGKGRGAGQADAGRHPGDEADGAGRQAGQHAVRGAQDEGAQPRGRRRLTRHRRTCSDGRRCAALWRRHVPQGRRAAPSSLQPAPPPPNTHTHAPPHIHTPLSSSARCILPFFWTARQPAPS